MTHTVEILLLRHTHKLTPPTKDTEENLQYSRVHTEKILNITEQREEIFFLWPTRRFLVFTVNGTHIRDLTLWHRPKTPYCYLASSSGMSPTTTALPPNSTATTAFVVRRSIILSRSETFFLAGHLVQVYLRKRVSLSLVNINKYSLVFRR